MFKYFTEGIAEKKGDESITEGIGQAILTLLFKNDYSIEYFSIRVTR